MHKAYSAKEQREKKGIKNPLVQEGNHPNLCKRIFFIASSYLIGIVETHHVQ